MRHIIFKYFFIFSVLLVSSFMLSVYMPGDALDYILMREEKTSISSTHYEHQKTLLAQRLGYYKPLFYFSVKSLAEYGWQQYFPSTQQQKSYNHLLRNYGCGSEVSTFYKKINAARTAIATSFTTATDTSIKHTAALAANCLYQIETQVNLRKNDSILHSFNTYAATLKLTALANSILHSYNEMQTNKSSWKKWVPVIQFNAQNRFHDWFFGTHKNNGIIHLNLGQSLYTGRSIGSLLKEKIFWSLLLTILAILIAFISGIFISMWLTYTRSKLASRIINIITVIFYSLPVYFAGTALLYFFSNPDFLQIFPSSGVMPIGGFSSDVSFTEKFLGTLPYLILPLICYTYSLWAFVQRTSASLISAELKKPYALMAQAKGLTKKEVVKRHIFPNIIAPFVALLANMFPAVIGGSVIIESLFSIPGMGLELIHATTTRNYPFISAVILITGLITMLLYLLNEWIQHFIDPRTKTVQS